MSGTSIMKKLLLALDATNVEKYSGTALARMITCRQRASSLSFSEVTDQWSIVRKRLLWAAGLKDISFQDGYTHGVTTHGFNDWNHVDVTCMKQRLVLYTCIHTYIHTYILTYLHACLLVYLLTYIHTYIHTYLHTYIHTYLHTYIHTY